MDDRTNCDAVAQGSAQMGKSMVKYCHWAASLAGVVLVCCGVLSLLLAMYFAPRVSALCAELGLRLPRLSQVMFSGIPGYLAIAFGAVLCAICFVRKTRLSLAAVLLSWLVTCLLMLLMIASIVVPMMTLQTATR